MFEASAATVGPDPEDISMVRIAAVSRRNRRALSCGIRMKPEELDALCLAWLRDRGVADSIPAGVMKSLEEARDACSRGLSVLGGE